jgi:hypothetical protein
MARIHKKGERKKQLQMQIMPAIKLGFAQMDLDDVNVINSYIDNNLHKMPDNSSSLVGQIKQDNRSAQPEFPLDDEMPKQLGNYFIGLAKEYASEHPLRQSIREGIGENEEYRINKMWSVHSYAGDYNPMHEHGTVSGRGVSIIVFLKVPPQIKNKGTQTKNSGRTDGVTQFIWDMNSSYDAPRFKHPTYAHVYPEVGKICVFPIWMHHQVSPFFGDGERRTMSCNIDIINYA